MVKDGGTYVDKRGRMRPRIATQGWKLLVEWKDSATSWVPLKDIKESFPIKTAEYAVANKLAEEPPLSDGSNTIYENGTGSSIR